MADKIPEEVKEFLKRLEEPTKKAEESLSKGEWFIKLGKEMGFDVSEQEKRQRELKERIEKIKEVIKKYLPKE